MLRVATFNLCNLGANAAPERLVHIGSIITKHLETPAIIALQEIMAETALTTSGPVPATSAYQALIAAIMHTGGAQYQFLEIAPLAHQDGGMSGANIRVGLLFDPAQVTFSALGHGEALDRVGIYYRQRQPSLTLNPGRIEPQHPAFVGDSRQHWAACRKPLAAQFAVGTQQLFVIVCHFKSTRSTAHRADTHAQQQRHAQAKVVHNFAADILACDPQAALVVLGDMNDVPGSKTLQYLKGAALYNLLEDVPPSECHTHWHGNQPQALDHILVSPALRPAASVRIVHLRSADGSTEAEPASDHDPVLASLPALGV